MSPRPRCPSCKLDLRYDARFCPQCGKPVKTAVAAPMTTASRPRSLEQISVDVLAGKERACLPELQAYVQVHAQDGEGWNILGRVHSTLGELDDAERAYAQALQLNPEDVTALVNQGVLCRERGETDRAIAFYERALQLDPKYAKGHTSLAVALLQQDRDDEAVRAAETAYRLLPKDDVVVSNLAAVYHTVGRQADATRLAREAEKLGYKNMDVLREILAGKRTLRAQRPAKSRRHQK